jgi:hypothetical protein
MLWEQISFGVFGVKFRKVLSLLDKAEEALGRALNHHEPRIPNPEWDQGRGAEAPNTRWCCDQIPYVVLDSNDLSATDHRYMTERE